jgi:hypothetical protein
MKRGIPFELTLDEAFSLFHQAGGKCTLTKIEFDLSPANGRKRPYAASIDRIDSSLGYTKENCRIISVAMNLALNWYGEEVFEDIAMAYIRQRYYENQKIPKALR